MNTFHKRKPNRLPDYDYASAGAYFITICTKDRAHILSRIAPVGADIIRPQTCTPITEHGDQLPCCVRLSELGAVVDAAIREIPLRYSNIHVDGYVVMPNHIHLLLRITEADGRMVSAPTVVGSLKRYVTKTLGISIWQKGFYDHVIRDEEDALLHRRYIAENPWKWLLGDDEYA